MRGGVTVTPMLSRCHRDFGTMKSLAPALGLGLLLVVTALVDPTRAVAADSSATYRNPILHSDYSDPDVIRVDDSYYMVASTFHFSPGLPVLKSKDLVH